MNPFYSNKFNNNFSLLLLSIIIFLFSFSPINSQENILSTEKDVFNETLINFNKTNIKLEHIKDMMSNIKYNIILKIKHKDLIRAHNSINSEVNKIKTQLEENKYDKNKIMEEIHKINKTMTKFDSKCNNMMNHIKRFDKTKKILLNMIKIFLIILFVIIIVVLLIISIVSFFVIRSQRRYHILHEEQSQDNIDVEDGRHYNNEFDKIKVKNEEAGSTDRKKIITSESSQEKKNRIRKKKLNYKLIFI